MTLFKYKKDSKVQLFFQKNKVLWMWIKHGCLQINNSLPFLVLKIVNGQNYQKMQAIIYQITDHSHLLKYKMRKA